MDMVAFCLRIIVYVMKAICLIVAVATIIPLVSFLSVVQAMLWKENAGDIEEGD